jgi:serine/threonine protein kinase
MDLLRKMLVADPAQRITAKLALEHPYFAMKEEEEMKIGSPCLTAASSKNKKVLF